jgi:hypothetical protein
VHKDETPVGGIAPVVGITEEQYKRVADAVELAVASFISRIPSIVEEILTTNVGRLMGLRRGSFGDKWEVDRMNGASPPVAQYIEDRAKKHTERLIGKIAFKIDKSQYAALQKDLHSRVKEMLRQQIWEKSKKLADESLTKMLTSNDVDVIRVDVTKELIHDPKFGATPLQKVILAQALIDEGMIKESAMKKLAIDMRLDQPTEEELLREVGLEEFELGEEEEVDESTG